MHLVPSSTAEFVMANGLLSFCTSVASIWPWSTVLSCEFFAATECLRTDLTIQRAS